MNSFLKLVPVKDIEPLRGWESFCGDPNSLFREFANRFIVDLGEFKNLSVIKSDTVPDPDDRSSIWVKTSFPYGIGVLINGEYKMDYGLSGYPANIPFLHAEIEEGTFPGPELKLLSSQELTDYGITDTASDASKRMRWYILEVEDIVI